MIKQIALDGHVLAIVIFSTFRADGIAFFTPSHYPQQLGYMNRPKGYQIPPHRHPMSERTVFMSQEVLLIRSGKIKITIYDQDENFVEDVVVATGDVIMLTDGGHSFEWLEDGEVIEIKQGPYLHSGDKVNFTPANSKEATA